MAFLEIENLQRHFGGKTGVKEFALSAERGEFVTLLGPSGCGKTTALRMVAGFEKPDEGRILVNGKDVTTLGPNQRNVGMVFQAYALFPNMTIAENIAFGLRVAKKPAAEITSRVAEMLDLIKLPQHAQKYPFQLSGGQQQRVALARALAVKPQMLLLDEPLSALDAKIRIALRDEIRAVQRALGITTLFVTHDQEEALSMSDRIVVMSEGRIEQIGTPFEIYNFPRTRFVASFVGTLNLLSGQIRDAKAGHVTVADQVLMLKAPVDRLAAGDTCILALRPEAIRIGADGAIGNALVGDVQDVSFMGSVTRIRVGVGRDTLSLDAFNSPSNPPPAPGERVTLTFDREDLRLLEA